jgi:hypothetical protein
MMTTLLIMVPTVTVLLGIIVYAVMQSRKYKD